MAGLHPEDLHMFNQQVVCGRCYNRFTTMEDCHIHILFMHDKQPSPSEIMEMLELILITVSGTENDNGGRQNTRNPRPKPPIA